VDALFVDSEPGRGTTVAAVLPQSEAVWRMTRYKRMWLRTGFLVVFGVVAAATIAIVRSDPDLAVTGDSSAGSRPTLVAGALVLAAAAASWRPGALFPLLFVSVFSRVCS